MYRRTVECVIAKQMMWIELNYDTTMNILNSGLYYRIISLFKQGGSENEIINIKKELKFYITEFINEN